ncbi:methenyltetrahydrofolate synthase domain-containing protein [Schistocerca cancellata]|uniref:methenyltetrahydrofolate synthase domain-containing protein n=1 Tax=Schistocerca cancellata TaxID=274614 RepID=UPI0021187B5E|nr:methenyltetrahydrofolate synthase domain-containing protein [Schistocerca cancellata]
MTSNEEVLPEEVTKQAFREKVWNYLEKNDLAAFPRPVHNRIPNFKGSGEAAHKLKEIDTFLASHVVKVNPDKPQETARLLALEAGKTVLVPIPRLRNGLLKQIQLPVGASNKDCRVGASRKGLELYGKPIGLDAKIKVDLVIIGSVAVSKEGHRIGKGEGYADLEFAMMVGMHAVDDDTVIITTVHDCQVFDSLPHQLFKSHDVPVDIIITPTQIINVTPRLPRPPGIIWSLLTEQRLREIPILQVLREQLMNEGKDCTLKEVGPDDDEHLSQRPPVRPNRNRERRNRNKQRSRGDSDSQAPVEESAADGSDNIKVNGEHTSKSVPGDVTAGQRSRMFHRRRRRNSRRDSANGPVGPSPEPGVETNNAATLDCTKGEAENHIKERPRRRRTRKRPVEIPSSQSPENVDEREVQDPERSKDQYRVRRAHRRNAFNFSLRVDNIGTDVRVRELKAALAERGVRPKDITWKGSKGFAMLHFRNPDEHENIIASLQDIKLREEGETLLVQLAQPTRIEVTDISSL